MKKIIYYKDGFSLMELLVSIFIIMILMLGVYGLIQLSLGITANNKSYVQAKEIANQRMERIRNLPYDDVGTTAGSPHGDIPDNETLTENGNFSVHTTIVFYDDAFDGTLAAGTDSIYLDYKIATIEVSWTSKYGTKRITIFSKVIPRTMETLSGYGVLRITSVDANGGPVPNADVHIENNILATPINVDLVTDANGELIYPVLPSFEGYEVTVSKTGYSTERTYPRTATLTDPTKPHLTVFDGLVTDESFAIDLMSALNITTYTQDTPDNWLVNDDSSGEDQLNSRFAFDSAGYIYIIWQDKRISSDFKIYAQKFDDDGNKQWPSDVVVCPATNQQLPDILTDTAGNLFVSWNNTSTGNQDAYLNLLSTVDGSDLWASRKIETDANNKDQMYPRIAIDSQLPQIVTVVWQDDRNTSFDVYMQRYDSAHTQKLTPEIRVNSNAIGDGTDQGYPVVAIDNHDDIYTAWTDGRDGDYNIYGAKFSSTTISQEWQQKLNTDAGTDSQTEPEIIIDSNNNLYIVWTDERNGDKDIYMQKYDLDGNVIWAADKKINIENSNFHQYEPSIAIDSTDIIYIVWTDERNGDKDIFGQKYDVDGNSLWTEDLRININPDNSDQYNPHVTINPIDNHPFASWNDERGGDADIYLTEFDVYGASTTIANIPLHVYGTKQIYNTPVILKYDNYYYTNGSGNLFLPVEWDSTGYMVEIVAASTTRTLIMPIPTQPVKVNPDETVNIGLIISP